MLSKRLDVITPSRTVGISSKVKEMKATRNRCIESERWGTRF